MLTSLFGDVRHALRGMRTHPTFTCVAVASLALGIGLNAAVFTVVDGLLFKPLPVESPDSLVAVFSTDETGQNHATMSYPDVVDLAASRSVFSSIIGHSLMMSPLGTPNGNRLAMGEVVTANFFDALGIRMALGRGFQPGEEVGAGAHPVTVLSDRLWRQVYGSSPDVIGDTITIKNRDYVIVGVAPPTFAGMVPGLGAELWIPVSMVEDVEPVGLNDVVPSATGRTRLERRGTRWLFVHARLLPGVTVDAADASVSATMARLAGAYPMSNEDRSAVALPASEVRLLPLVDDVLRPTGAVLLAAVGLVLLVACANVASMLLARNVSRTREFALRTALGARRWRLVRQLTVEHLMLALAGGAVGLVVAAWAIRAVVAYQLPFELALDLTFAINGRVVLFATVLSLVTGLVVSLLPAIRSSRTSLVGALKADAPLVSASSRRYGLGHGLVALQVAVSLVLVVGGVLLGRSLSTAYRIDPGFDPSGLAVTTMSLDFHGYGSEDGQRFWDQAVERIGGLPGVSSVSIASKTPFSPNVNQTSVTADGQPELTSENGLAADTAFVTATYFQTMGLSIVEGRNFDSRDTPESPRVVVVSQALARRLWPGGTAVGKRLRDQGGSRALMEIVGVVNDHKVRTLGEAPRPLVHFARSQGYSPYGTIIARAPGDPNALVRSMTRELFALDPSLVLMEAQPFERLITLSLLPIRAGVALIGGLAGLAMLLSGLGLYGVIAFSVGRRTREIGIRMALGADHQHVLRQVLKEGLLTVGVGGLVGLGLAALGGQALRAALHVSPLDPVSYLAATVMLAATALVAAGLPARRAAALDPAVALRQS